MDTWGNSGATIGKEKRGGSEGRPASLSPDLIIYSASSAGWGAGRQSRQFSNPTIALFHFQIPFLLSATHIIWYRPSPTPPLLLSTRRLVYSAWERELNENTNGLLRQYFPNRRDGIVTQADAWLFPGRCDHRFQSIFAYGTTDDFRPDYDGWCT